MSGHLARCREKHGPKEQARREVALFVSPRDSSAALGMTGVWGGQTDPW